MKKLLSLLLSLTLVFTLAVPALAFDDVGGIDEKFSDALNVMVSLGAIEGMGDGTFTPVTFSRLPSRSSSAAKSTPSRTCWQRRRPRRARRSA